ncbi:MAG: NeuD/PglB/VioB family sugar acetyltransferase [Phycisphaerales bacterium]
MGGTGIILIGGGGHAKVVFDAIRASDMVAAGFCDDQSRAALSGFLEHLGGVSSASGHGGAVVIAVGDIATRRGVISALGGGARVAEPIIHPSAVVSASAELSEGVFVGPGAIVNADARVGGHAIVNSGSIVEHDCRIGENAHVAPGAVLGGGVGVGCDTLVGMGARVLGGVTIGDGCVVGAGAVVTRDVGDGDVVVGVPGRRRD